MISIIHPSRGRPDRSLKTITKWLECASTEIEVILSLDSDDPFKDEYISKYLSGPTPCFKLISDNRTAIEAINIAAIKTTGEIIMVVSDDTDCFPGWDTVLLEIVKGKSDWIMKTQDSIQSWVITMPIMDRTYYNRFGYIYHPDYQHAFCDTEMTCVADLTGRKIVSTLMFKHLHYSEGHNVKDAINVKCDSYYEAGKAVFIERLRNNFGLTDMPGKLSDNVYTRMK